MGPNGKDARGTRLRLALPNGSDARERRPEAVHERAELLFDFTGLHRPEVSDLSLILTARMQSAPGARVWVHALPEASWDVLRILGLDHLFRVFPGSHGTRN